MKIVIAGGRDRADFLISFLMNKKHVLTVINDSPEYCKYLASTHEIPIIYGDPCKEYVLEEAHIREYDVLIALKPDDADNLAICQCAKRVFGIKKVVCTVSNPKNVDVFKRLGVNTVISATYMISQHIERATSVESLREALSIEDGKIVMDEMIVDDSHYCSGKKVRNLNFPPNTIITCVMRGENNVFVPSADTVIETGDKLFVLSSPANRDAAVTALTGK
ncbi:MAG: TrkA family potassium uptake protein [Abditibacteriota bacterium]|nr:TrkA family potassium uptake protein [Abditibacteriota bacterium]MBP5093435.1 TrkA family potassium uptake protein [Abditibacteriota bacterium]MBP5737477.1 TrkA family potassium uptake protein [Abditibacteriota bacterium]